MFSTKQTKHDYNFAAIVKQNWEERARALVSPYRRVPLRWYAFFCILIVVVGLLFYFFRLDRRRSGRTKPARFVYSPWVFRCALSCTLSSFGSIDAGQQQQKSFSMRHVTSFGDPYFLRLCLRDLERFVAAVQLILFTRRWGYPAFYLMSLRQTMQFWSSAHLSISIIMIHLLLCLKAPNRWVL